MTSVALALLLALAPESSNATRYRQAADAVASPDPTPLRRRAIQASLATQRPVALVQVEPHRPAQAELAGSSGRLVIECVVDEEGLVRECLAIERWAELEPLATEALRQWRFRPATLDGKPQAVLLRWTWEHVHERSGRDWKPRWRFRWDRPALSYEW